MLDPRTVRHARKGYETFEEGSSEWTDRSIDSGVYLRPQGAAWVPSEVYSSFFLTCAIPECFYPILMTGPRDDETC